MKTHRLLVALLFVSLTCIVASAQESGELVSLRTKAEKGNGIAQYNLGLAYAEGRGVAADPQEAFVWLSLARENGARGRALDNLVSSFDRATLEAAQQRLAARKASSPATAAARPETTAPAVHAAPASTLADDVPALAAPREDPIVARLRSERDSLSAKLGELAAELASLRAERERLATQSAENAKAVQAARESSNALQEQNRAAEARVAGLVRESETLKAELERTKQSLAALEQAPKPAPDTAALDQKLRELQASQADLEASRNFGREVEATLNRVTDQKIALEAQLAALTAETQKARQETTDLRAAQAELNARVAATPAYPNLSDRVSELEAQVAAGSSSLASAKAEADNAKQQVAALNQANAAAAPQLAEFAALKSTFEQNHRALVASEQRTAALNSRVADLEQQAARPAAPAYPNLSGRVGELEAQVASGFSALAAAKAETANAQRQVAALTEANAAAEKLAAEKPAAPAYPDLSGRVRELEAALAAKPAAPAYPDFSGRVRELEAQVSTDSTALASAQTAAANAQQSAVALTKAQEDAQARIGALTAERDAARTAQNELGGAVAKLEQEKNKLTAAQASTAGTAAQITALGEKAAAAEQQAAALRQERDTLAGKMNDLVGNLAALQTDRERMSKLLADAGRQMRDATAATNRIKELEAQIQGHTAETEAARTVQAELRDSVTRLEEEKTQLTAALQSARTAAPAYPDLTGRVRELESALAAKPAAPTYPDLSSRVSELEAQVTAGTAALASAQTEAENARQRAVALTQAKEAAEKSAAPAFPDLSGKVAELEIQVGSLQSAPTAKPAAPSYPDLSGRVGELETALAAAQKLAAEKPAALAYPDLSGRVSELEVQVAAESSTVAAAKTEVENAKQQIVALTQAKEAAEKSAAEKSAAPAYPDLSGRVQELEATLASLTQKAGASDQARADLAKQFDDYKSSTLATQRESTRQQAEIKMLESDKAALRRQVDTMTTEAAQGRTPVAALKAPATPTYPDLSGKVVELEAQLATARKLAAEKPAAPSYPDLSGRVNELEAAVAAAGTAQAELQRKLDGAAVALQQALKEQNGEERVQLRRERDELSGRVTGLASEVAQLRLDRERMQKMLADAGKQMRDGAAEAGRIKELEAQTASQQNSLNVLSADASQARDQIAALTKAKGEAQSQVGALQAALAAKSGAPAYPDLADKVRELETQVVSLQSALAAKPAALAYPDLSGRVNELETALADTKRQLAAEQAKPAPAAVVAATPAVDVAGLQQRLAETEEKLAISLRGYATLADERDALAANARKNSAAITGERDALSAQVAALTSEVAQLKSGATAQTEALNQAAKLATDKNSLEGRLAELEARMAAAQAEAAHTGESLAALQRSSAQNTTELAASRTLVRQLQGSNSVLASENYQLKTMLARSTGAAAPTPVSPMVSPPAARMHTVASGDSLSRISQRYYGTAGRWQEIYAANRDRISDTGVLRVGTELRIP